MARRRTAAAAVAMLSLLVSALAAPAAPARAAGPFTLSTDTLAFGSLELQAGTTLSVTLTNDDAASHAVGTASISDGAADFSLAADTCSGATVPPAGTCGITVRFRPSTTGARTGSLSIPTDGGATTYGVALSGTGLADLSGIGPVSFGDVQLGAPAVTRVATIVNAGGSVTLSPASTSVTGVHAADFAIVTDGCSGTTLGPAQGCEMTLSFAPTGVGNRSATLVISGAPPLGDLEIALGGRGTAPPSPVAWGTIHPAGPNNTWTLGMALARTVDAGTQRLHLVYNTDRIGGKWAKDVGPFMGVYYTRSLSGATWSDAKRLNPSSVHAERGAIAATGARVYAVYVTQKKVVPLPDSPRVIYVRVNTDHGAWTKWKSPVRLTGTKGRVDYPSVAASGKDAYVAWTDAKTGSVRLAITHDGGARWRIQWIGSTTHTNTEGFKGDPVVSVWGSTVAVAWTSNDTHGQRVRISSDKGSSWSPVHTLTAASNSTVSMAVRGTRVAAAWTVDQGVLVSVATGGTWSPPALAAEAADTSTPAVVLQDAGRVGVAYSEGDLASSALRWVESPDDGVAWYPAQTIGSSGTTRAVNDWPSVVWPSAGTRIVAWNGENNTDTYRQYARTGSGTPPGLPTVALRLTWLAPASGPGANGEKTR